MVPEPAAPPPRARWGGARVEVPAQLSWDREGASEQPIPSSPIERWGGALCRTDQCSFSATPVTRRWWPVPDFAATLHRLWLTRWTNGGVPPAVGAPHGKQWDCPRVRRWAMD